MVGVDIGEVVNVRGDVFEDEHDVVSFVEVYLLVSFDGGIDLLLFVVFLQQLL